MTNLFPGDFTCDTKDSCLNLEDDWLRIPPTEIVCRQLIRTKHTGAEALQDDGYGRREGGEEQRKTFSLSDIIAGGSAVAAREGSR